LNYLKKNKYFKKMSNKSKQEKDVKKMDFYSWEEVLDFECSVNDIKSKSDNSMCIIDTDEKRVEIFNTLNLWIGEWTYEEKIKRVSLYKVGLTSVKLFGYSNTLHVPLKLSLPFIKENKWYEDEKAGIILKSSVGYHIEKEEELCINKKTDFETDKQKNANLFELNKEKFFKINDEGVIFYSFKEDESIRTMIKHANDAFSIKIEPRQLNLKKMLIESDYTALENAYQDSKNKTKTVNRLIAELQTIGAEKILSDDYQNMDYQNMKGHIQASLGLEIKLL